MALDPHSRTPTGSRPARYTAAEQLHAIRNLMEVMVEPLSRSLASAPVEEEELTPEAAEALDRAKASLARAKGIPHDEILREFGLKQ